jgi:hypothetical protein
MNKVTRHGVFETNSSSTHSIAIQGGKYVLDKLPVEDGVCRVYPGEFGWEEEDYYDADTKASYCLTHAWSAGDGRDGYKMSPEKAASRLDMLRDVIQKATGAEKVEFAESGDDFYKRGYIDHQSIEGDGGAGEPAFASEESLRDFIFNPNSLLRTDNDNH